MNPELLQYIRTLSVRDKKTVSSKALKAAEELGEVARLALPFDSAYATNHRFVDKKSLLEECVDLTLCALSIAYHIGSTDEEVEEMMVEKSKKWAQLQNYEDKASFPLPFEIHITVKSEKTHMSPDQFKVLCQNIGTKAVLLDLQTRKNSLIRQELMTSSKHFGSNYSAFMESQRVKEELERAGLKVIRVKIETVPWHPASPKKYGAEMPENCYFEAHIPVTIFKYREEELAKFAEKYDLHLSKNAFKTYEDGSYTMMLTLRRHNDWEGSFIIRAKTLPDDLIQTVEVKQVGDVIVEFAIYDTNVSSDASWIYADARAQA